MKTYWGIMVGDVSWYTNHGITYNGRCCFRLAKPFPELMFATEELAQCKLDELNRKNTFEPSDNARVECVTIGRKAVAA